jgi:cell division protein FtsB
MQIDAQQLIAEAGELALLLHLAQKENAQLRSRVAELETENATLRDPS